MGLSLPARLGNDVVQGRYRWLSDINLRHGQGGDFVTNCLLTAIATDLSVKEFFEYGDVSMSAYQAPPAGLAPLEHLDNYGAPDQKLTDAAGYASITAAMLDAGYGARGMVVIGTPGQDIAHVINVITDVINGKNVVVFLDGQNGQEAKLPQHPVRLRFKPTSEGLPLSALKAGAGSPAPVPAATRAPRQGALHEAPLIGLAGQGPAGGNGGEVAQPQPGLASGVLTGEPVFAELEAVEAPSNAGPRQADQDVLNTSRVDDPATPVSIDDGAVQEAITRTSLDPGEDLVAQVRKNLRVLGYTAQVDDATILALHSQLSAENRAAMGRGIVAQANYVAGSIANKNQPLTMNGGAIGFEIETRFQVDVLADEIHGTEDQIGALTLVDADHYAITLDKYPLGPGRLGWIIELVSKPMRSLTRDPGYEYSGIGTVMSSVLRILDRLNHARPGSTIREIFEPASGVTEISDAADNVTFLGGNDLLYLQVTVGVPMSGLLGLQQFARDNSWYPPSRKVLGTALEFGDLLGAEFIGMNTDGMSREDLAEALDRLSNDSEVVSLRGYAATFFSHVAAQILGTTLPVLGKNLLVVASRVSLDRVLAAQPGPVRDFLDHSRHAVGNLVEALIRRDFPHEIELLRKDGYRVDQDRGLLRLPRFVDEDGEPDWAGPIDPRRQPHHRTGDYLNMAVAEIPRRVIGQRNALGVRTSFPDLPGGLFLGEIRAPGRRESTRDEVRGYIDKVNAEGSRWEAQDTLMQDLGSLDVDPDNPVITLPAGSGGRLDESERAELADFAKYIAQTAARRHVARQAGVVVQIRSPRDPYFTRPGSRYPLRATAVRSELTSLVGQELVRRRVPGAPIEIPPLKIEIEPSEADELSIAVIPAPANEQWNMAPLLSRLRRDRASAALGQGSAVRVRHPLDRHPKWGRLFTAAHSWADALPAERKDETFLGAAEVLDRWHARPTVHRDGRPSRGQEDYLELRTRMTELIAYQLGLDGYVVTAETLAQELQLDFGPRRVSDGPALTAEIGFVVGETTLPESETRRLQEFARNLAEHISSQGARSDPSGLPHAVVHIEGGRSELGSPGPDEARERRVRMARDLVRRTVNARLLELGASASLLSSFVSYDVSAPWRGSPGQSSSATTTGQQPHQVRIWTSVPRPPWEVLGALAGPVEDGAPMRVAPHPADEETAARRGVQLVEATQRMVPGARDLEVARWLLAEDPVQAAGSSQWVRTGLGEDLMRSSSASQEALRKTLRQQVDRIDDDLHLFITMWERSPQVWRTLRPVQAAALVVIERRGREVHDHAHEAARRRFEGTEWGRLYSGLDINELLRTVHEHLRKGMKLVTNVSDDRLDSLLADPEGRFRNYWETGTTEGADDSEARRIAESAMGYTASLQGTLDGHARPTAQDARDLPKYAALLPRRRPGGLSGYGNIALHWKQEVRARSTFVPDDSLDYGSVSGVREITGPDNLYPLLAYGADGLARLAFAEATGFAYDSELAQMLADERTEAVAGFFEAQIHGDLSWSDVEQVVILYDEEFVEYAEEDRARIENFGRAYNPGLRVALSPDAWAEEGEPLLQDPAG